MLTTLVIGTTAYSSDGTAFAGWSGPVASWASVRLFGLTLDLDDESYSTASFTAIGCGPAMPFAPGSPIRLILSDDDGSSPSVALAGDVQRPEMRPSAQGPAWSYLCTDLKKRSDYAWLLASNGTAVASYNLPPNDPLYLFNLAGMTVGQIVVDVLQGLANATALSNLGVGNYVTLSPPTLPARTLADLAALQLVPPGAVQLQGPGILNQLTTFLQYWQSQYTLYVEPDGTIRVASIFGRPTYNFTQPSYLGEGDPIDELTFVAPDVTDCYAAVQVIGQDIAGFTATTSDGTLALASSNTDVSTWRYANFAGDDGTADDGAIVSITATSCVVRSHHPRVKWALNYWNDNGGVINFYWLAGTGIDIHDVRQITSCTAMSPGGTATITWDPSQPLATSSYTTYRMQATNSELDLVGRDFVIREPSTGKTGLDTFIGSRMFPYFPYGYAWGNYGRGASEVSVISYPAANVLWSSTGAWPWFGEPDGVSLDPKRGHVILNTPAQVLSAAMAGQTAGLAGGYPATYFAGKPVDVQVAIPYNRGDLSVRAPASGFSGTANSKYGVDRVMTIALPGFVYAGNGPALLMLASEHLAVVQDAVTSGSVRLRIDHWTPSGGTGGTTYFPPSYFPPSFFGGVTGGSGGPATPFNPISLGYAITIATPGAASPIDGLNLPVRGVTLEWPSSGADIHLLTMRFSNRHRPFEGDDLRTPRSFSGDGWGTQQGQTFVGGILGGMYGTVDSGQFAEGMTSLGLSSAPGGGDAGDGGPVYQAPPGFFAEPDRGPGLKQTRNDTRRQIRLEKEQKGRDDAKARREQQARDAKGAAGRTVPEPGDVSAPQVVRERSLREQRNDDTLDGGG